MMIAVVVVRAVMRCVIAVMVVVVRVRWVMIVVCLHFRRCW